jgi:serine/threonine protein kinase
MSETVIHNNNNHGSQHHDIQQQHDPTRPHKTIGSYVLSKTLGRGSMGKVKLAINMKTSEKVLTVDNITCFFHLMKVYQKR